MAARKRRGERGREREGEREKERERERERASKMYLIILFESMISMT
jgi:hypothetical protein